MNDTIYGKMSDLLLFAVGFKKGDKVYLKYSRGQEELALKVTEKAYKGGAEYVLQEVIDDRFKAAALLAERENFWFPDYLKAQMAETCSPGWKYIGIFSEIDSDVYEDCDQNKASAFFRDQGIFNKPRQTAIMKNAIPWTLTYVPSAPMAKKAYPGLADDEAIAKYWDAIIRIMRLDHDDPVAFWKEKMERDARRSAYMDSLGATHLHFKSSSTGGAGSDKNRTDLLVGLAKEARWIGGFDQALEGTSFMANIPTEEIFTSPDWRQTEGRVALTRPFTMHHNLGPTPTGAWFEFKEGKVVNYGADEGRDTLKAFFDIDPRACYIGEVALVDPHSPMATEGVTFYNGLYDENAACHLALGKAYPFTLKNPRELSDDELLELGLNTANVHEDMMIGGLNVNVYAVLADGSEKPIIENGKFLI